MLRPNPINALAWIVAMVLACTSAWRIVSLGIAEHFARSDPERALGWRSKHPLALGRAAEKILGSEPARAEELARTALQVNPLDGRSHRVLGHLAGLRGDSNEALRRYEQAARLSPRDLSTHAWLQRHYLQAGQLQPALRHIDLMLRVEPETRVRQYVLLQLLAEQAAAQAGMAELLARRPPWRAGFIAHLCRYASDSGAIRGLITRLQSTDGGLAEGEFSAWLDRLVRDRRWHEAYLAWVASLPTDRRQGLTNVFNGSFEHEPGNTGFDWRIGHAPGAFIERLPTPGAAGAVALRLSFEDRRVPFNHVRQLLVLSPGRYRLTGRARAEGLRSARGLVWSVHCAEDERSLAAAKPVSGYSPWREFAVVFDVPALDCGGQWLRLGVPSRIRAEQRTGGQAWFDDLRIVRESLVHPGSTAP